MAGPAAAALPPAGPDAGVLRRVAGGRLRAGATPPPLLPGVRFDRPGGEEADLAFSVGPTTYRRTPPQGRAEYEYVVLAKVRAPGVARPVFVLAGQTAVTNLAAARFLVNGYRRLLRRYGPDGSFCLVLRVREPESYGPDLVELAVDATEVAFQDGEDFSSS